MAAPLCTQHLCLRVHMTEEVRPFTPREIAEGIILGNLTLPATIKKARTDATVRHDMIVSIRTLLLDEGMSYELLLPAIQVDGKLDINAENIDTMVASVVKALLALCTE